jgi:hypothetical protein
MRALRGGLLAAALVSTTAGITASAATATAAEVPYAQIQPGTAIVEITAEPGAEPIDRSGRWQLPADDILIHERHLDGEASIVIDLGTVDERGNQPLLQLFTGDDKRIRRGVYTGSYSPASAPDEPGVLGIENGIGCYGTASTFTIRRITHDAKGQLSRLEASVDYRCGTADAPAVHARINYRA